MRIPISTYRLQVTQEFDLHAVSTIVPYLASLGADWIYLSPLLKASVGSEHGYDVVDHSLVDPARGGAEGLQDAARAAHEAGLGVLVDIVPNHVGVAHAEENAWWWDVLTYGEESRYAGHFDIDWPFGNGKLRIPVLGSDSLDGLEIVGDELHYFENRFPIRPNSGGGTPAEVLARQHYELIDWRRGDDLLNFRRFFAVSTLAGIRVELPPVFEESHREIVRWFADGLADGLRVDHPDGLADPGGYLDDLAAATGNAYVLVEKILEGDEQLPTSWATAGTTGYDALADVDRVFVDPAGRAALDALDRRLRGVESTVSWPALIHQTKRGIADGILRAEVVRLERDSAVPDSADALAELLACFPVYRSYLPLGLEHLQEAVLVAKNNRPDLTDTIDRLLPLLSDPRHPAAIRFQQTSGMVMAKGVEDTAFYRYTRLGSLTEVGADPSEFSIGVAEFHRRQQARQASFPASLTTLSTHDTKRGEDVRARISVLAEVADEWERALTELQSLQPLGDGPLEALLWEAIVGAWPASRERLHEYAVKAAREAGNSTGWSSPSEDFEQRMHALVDSAFDDERVADIVRRLVDLVERPGWSNSLGAKLIQLTAPGVPDVYQGSELWETSLVDPDNRRPVDFDIRRLYLAAIDAGSHPPIDATGAAKLLVTTRALRCRREQQFTRYAPVTAFGEQTAHLVGFDSGPAITLATRLPVGLARAGGWGDTAIQIAGHTVRDMIADREYEGGTLRLAEVFERYPVALLVTA